jgi:hypothetical protein
MVRSGFLAFALVAAAAVTASAYSSPPARISFNVTLSGVVTQDASFQRHFTFYNCDYVETGAWHNKLVFHAAKESKLTGRRRSGRFRFPPFEIRALVGSVTTSGGSSFDSQTPGCQASTSDCSLRKQEMRDGRATVAFRHGDIVLSRIQNANVRFCGNATAYGSRNADIDQATASFTASSLTGVSRRVVNGSFEEAEDLVPQGFDSGSLNTKVSWKMTFVRAR